MKAGLNYCAGCGLDFQQWIQEQEEKKREEEEQNAER
jgi:hypothetical protein